MPVSALSSRAYDKHVVDGKAVAQRERILHAIRCFGPVSRGELAELFSDEGLDRHGIRWWAPKPTIPLGSICGRANVLLGNEAKGWPAYVRVAEVRVIRGHRVGFLVAIDPAPAEMSFAAFSNAFDRAARAYENLGDALRPLQGKLGL